MHYTHRSQRALRELSMRKRRFVWRRPDAKSHSSETTGAAVPYSYECSREWTVCVYIRVLNARDSYAPGPAIAINCMASCGAFAGRTRARARTKRRRKNWKSRRATLTDADSTRRPAVCEKLVCVMSRGLSFLRAVLASVERMRKPEKKIQQTWIDFWQRSKILRKFIKIFL